MLKQIQSDKRWTNSWGHVMLGAQAFGIKAVRVVWHEAVPAKKCEIANWQFSRVFDLNTWIRTDILPNLGG